MVEQHRLDLIDKVVDVGVGIVVLARVGGSGLADRVDLASTLVHRGVDQVGRGRVGLRRRHFAGIGVDVFFWWCLGGHVGISLTLLF